MSKEPPIVDVPTEGLPDMRSGKPTPEQQKYLNLVRQLTDACATLVVKVAVCNCNHKAECGVFSQAQQIATVMDQLLGARASSGGLVKGVGKSRRRVRA